MRIEVVASEGGLDDIIDELEKRRGRILSQAVRDGMRVVNARVPLAAMFGYASELRSRTQGRGTFTMRLDGYEAAPRKPSPRPRQSSIALSEPDDAGY